MQEKEADLSGKSKARCLIGEMDGAMIPIVIFEANESLDRRKWRKMRMVLLRNAFVTMYMDMKHPEALAKGLLLYSR